MVGLANRQEIDTRRGPPGNYSHLQRPLPNPPRGQYWRRDAATNNEWILEDDEEDHENNNLVIVDDGQVVVVDDTNMNGMGLLLGDDDIIEHLVDEKHDTFEGLCLRYKISPTELRQANGGFSGTNLKLAPNPLRIMISTTRNHRARLLVNAPMEETTTTTTTTTDDDQQSSSTTARQMSQIKITCPRLSNSEARCYLQLNDGNLDEAIANAREDGF